MSSQEEIAVSKAAFTEWVKAFGVFETCADDEIEITEEMKPFLWTEFQNGEESFVSQGYFEPNPDLRMPVVGYYLSKMPYPQDGTEYPIVMISMLLDCDDCEGMGEDDEGEECETCLGEMGTYVEFDLDAQ